MAIGGSTTPERVVIISSGLHGIEGFFGSALQLALLESLSSGFSLAANVKIVLIHALNPFGFAWRRRWNEDNIDLNRNFLLPAEAFEGSPADYANFNAFLNPSAPPSKFEPYLLKAIWLILQYGMTQLKNTLPVGQYDFPKGLFFGGHTPAQTQVILANHLSEWIGPAINILHLDFHTGLGPWGTYKLLLPVPQASAAFARLVERFGAECFEPCSQEGVSYQIRGGLASWCQNLFPDRCYDLLTAEFGTYSTIQVLKALRAENRAHWWGKPNQSYEWTKADLVEMFAPASEQWREKCIAHGLDLCRRALLK